MEYSIGDKVKILPPFEAHFPGEFTIKELHPEFVLLEELESAFAYMFIKKV